MPKRSRIHVALYGSVSLLRGRCPDCDGDALILGGKFACCGRPFESSATAVKRMTQGGGSRKTLSRQERLEILSRQENCCIYCGVLLGAIVHRKSRSLHLRTEYDHAIPYSYCNCTSGHNMVAACHVCNGLKSDKMFTSIADAAIWLADQRAKKGYDF
jgi:hypothetical protein